MKSLYRPGVPALLASVLAAGAGWLAWEDSAAAQPAAIEQTVMAAAAGVIAPIGGASESVVFDGQATIVGKVIRDPDFGAPPVLELIVDLSGVKGRGARTGTAYLVSAQAILHRPLLALDPIEIAFSFAAGGNMLLARSAMASFDVHYSGAKGISTTPVRVTLPPAN